MLSRVEFRHFEPGDGAAFRDLNQAWIAGYFEIEEKDWEVLNDPMKHILDPGGALIMAFQDGAAVGTCALLAMGRWFVRGRQDDRRRSKLRGQGIGKRLLEHVIGYARETGAKRLYLETNNKLATAIHVYESLGFRHLPPERIVPSPYARANVYMELLLG